MAAGRVLAPPAPSAATRAAEQTDEEQPGAAQVNGDAGVLRLRWNSHVESLQELFESLLDQQLFVDVTLACDGGSLRAHRVMLSAVSSYFRRVLSETTSKCPVIIMRDVPAAEMHFILQFIYRGEIHVPEDRLPSLLRTARLLEIRGLSDKLAGEDVKEKPAAEVGGSVNPIANGNNGRIAGRGTRDSLFKTKRPTQLMVKEEDLDEDEDMESDCDVPDGRQMTSTGNGNHSVSEDRSSPSVPPLDLSNGASDEENEVPSCKKRSTRTKSSSLVSPMPSLVKCEQAEEEMDEELEDEEELDEELLDEEEELIEATTGHHHHHQGGSSNGASFPFGLSASSTSGSSAATPTGAGGGSGLVVQAVCPFCFKDCKRTAELRAHIRAHTGEKPFRCDICSAPFARSAHLKRHRRVHTGERPFECHRCQKTFSRQDKLKLHMDRHRLRDTGGSKMIVGRPKKLPGTGTNSNKKNGPISDAEIPGTSSSSSEMMNGVNNSSSAMSGMGQFAFPGAPARPSSSQSSSSSASAPSSRSTPYGDLNYFSLLSLSQRGLTISSSPGSSPSGSSVPHLLSPQTLQELHLFQQRQHQQQQQQHRPGRPVRSTRSGGPQSRHLRDSASETLLNFAQQVVEVVAAPSAATSTTQS